MDESLRRKLIELLTEENGLTDAEIAHRLRQYVPNEQAVALLCRQLEIEGVIKRIKRINKPTGNYLTEDHTPTPVVDVSDDLPAQDLRLEFDADSTHMVELNHLGFARCGEWFSTRDKVTYYLDESGDRSNLLFAFVVDGTVVYLARCQRTLRNRMNTVLNPRDDLNTRLFSYCEGLLRRQKKVDIYAFEDPGTFQFAGYKVSLTAGLEPSLIEYFRPTWNMSIDKAA